MRLITLLTAMTVLVGQANIAAASEEDVRLTHSATKIVLLLSFDRNLDKRSGNNIKMGLVHGSATTPKHLTKLKKLLESPKIANLISKKLVAEIIKFEDPKKFRSAATKGKYTAFYIAEDLAASISSITQISRGLKVPTFSGNAELPKNGLAVGIVIEGDKALLYINLAAARSEGLDLPSSVLIIAHIVG